MRDALRGVAMMQELGVLGAMEILAGCNHAGHRPRPVGTMDGLGKAEEFLRHSLAAS